MVVGELLDAGGAPIAEAEIQLFDRDIGANWQQLGDEHYITNSDGRFVSPIRLEQFSDADAAPPLPT
ncbi:hypothetical protein F2981_32760 (plasmid) [Sinorhizobium meliloti]|nr:hypothetical protein [Sinorhizobium meliloti]